MPYAIINIGTNLGNRRLNIARAVGAIINRFGAYSASHIMESEPWGFESEHTFLNICLMFCTDLTPHQLLQSLREIEQTISPASHRKADGSYADRLIDIDLIDYDRQVIDSPDLTLPHPRLQQRRFFLQPLNEVAPEWRHPVSNLTPQQMLDAME